MDANTAMNSGVPQEYLYQLANGSYVHRGMFVSFGPDSNCTLELCPVAWTVYEYRPSLPANIIFAVLYAIALGGHVYLGVRWRSWSFMTFMIIGCLVNIIGYIARCMLWANPWSFIGFLIQMTFITTAPVFYSAAIYITLSRAFVPPSPCDEFWPPL